MDSRGILIEEAFRVNSLPWTANVVLTCERGISPTVREGSNIRREMSPP